jgi:hypothetical protein
VLQGFESLTFRQLYGEMAEWLNAPVLKTGMGLSTYRRFESYSLRQKNYKVRMKRGIYGNNNEKN